MYCSLLHPENLLFITDRDCDNPFTPWSMLTSGLNIEVAQFGEFLSVVRFGLLAPASPQAGVICVNPNDLLSWSVHPLGIPHGISELIKKISKSDSCIISDFTINLSVIP